METFLTIKIHSQQKKDIRNNYFFKENDLVNIA
jgi:hypothetical protein